MFTIKKEVSLKIRKIKSNIGFVTDIQRKTTKKKTI
jgi:hypothetical protein